MSAPAMPSPGLQHFAKDVSTGRDNLYVASIVAVNVNTGELKWHYQMVPGDQWDYDSVQQMTLADLNINGRTRKVIMQANKNGFFYVLDRSPGEFISAQPFSRVTWAKGIDQKTGRPIINTEVHVRRGSGAGIARRRRRAQLVADVFQSSDRARLHSIARVGHVHVRRRLRLQTRSQPSRRTGTNRTESQHAGHEARSPPDPPSVRSRSKAATLSTLVAYDPVKQEIRWRVPVGNSRYGGTVTHREQSRIPGRARWTPDRVLGRQRRKAFRNAHRHAQRHGSADHIRD